MGTVNVLDIAFKKDFVKAIIVVSTDKVYRNDNSGRAFIESDPLEGKDPYSASKVGTEAVVAAWQQIAKVSGGPKVVSVRAGNVIGGGDFAENRIIPDLIRGAMRGESVEIRNPESTRPWQHVLDPLIGYLMVLEKSLVDFTFPNYNFAPTGKNLTVREVALIASKFIPETKLIFGNNPSFHDKESSALNLNAEMSMQHLNWVPTLTQRESIDLSFAWWINLMKNDFGTKELCIQDVSTYFINRK
jgi:CDP-glucose 4,6-dehydratase